MTPNPLAARVHALIAEVVAVIAHAGQTTKSEGEPFIRHPEAVAALVPLELKAAAWLHDVLEDTPVTPDDLRRVGISDSTIDVVQIVSRGAETYEAFIARIAASGNQAAIALKLADLRHNLRPSCPESLARRYRPAVAALETALEAALAAALAPHSETEKP